MTLIKAEQIVIREDKGRIAAMHNHDVITPRPIASYEQEIRYLKMQLAAKDTEIKQKEAEIQECNEILTNNHKVQNVLLDTIKIQYKKIQELRGTRDEE
jgi:hypothetical protein